MPLLRITHHPGALDDKQKAQLAETLTAAILIGEVGADTPQGRPLAYVVFQEVDPRTAWFVGGKPDIQAPKGGRFVLEVFYPYGAASQADKTTLHATINRAVAQTLGVDGDFPHRVGDWVLIHEVADGNWGASGVTLGIPEINAAAGGSPQRADFFDPLLKANQRVREAHGFPAGSSRS